MKKNGFTLIELLAVIVILAIIALIATPIILGIINDAREKANERSIELYASALRNGIAAYQLRELKEVAVGSYTSETLPFDVEYDGSVECTKVELYDNGGVYVAGCRVNDTEVEYTYGKKQIIKGNLQSICNPISVQTKGTYTAGDKYECDVDPNKEGYDYIFYVLNSNSTEVNLIMDSNIRLDATPVKETTLAPIKRGTVAWYAAAQDTSYGPITAMNHLQAATAGWTNTNELTIDKFTSCTYKGCTDKPMTEYKVNARMPYYSEVSEVSTSALYLIDYLDSSKDTDNGITGRNGVPGVNGYWTLSSNESVSGYAWYVSNFGDFTHNNVNSSGGQGVRPVINLSI